MELQVFGYRFHSLPNSVADDQKEETPTPEICSERIVELLFVNFRVNRPHLVKQRVAVALQAMAHLALDIRRRPAGKFFGIIENLADYLTPRLGITPELAFDEHWQAGRRDHKIIYGAGVRVQLGANWHRARKHRVDLRNRQAPGVLMNEISDVCLARGFAA